MSRHGAVVVWNREGALFSDHCYSRAHAWLFDGGIQVPASSSPQVVPTPLSLSSAVDPEEAFVASLSSCHMLWFLHLAATGGFIVESYRDEAIGVLATDASGLDWMSVVTLHPHVRFAGPRQPSAEQSLELHHAAHDLCYLARSVRTQVLCEPVYSRD